MTNPCHDPDPNQYSHTCNHYISCRRKTVLRQKEYMPVRFPLKEQKIKLCSLEEKKSGIPDFWDVPPLFGQD